MHEVHVGDADEAEELAHVRRLSIGSLRVDATARDEYDRLFTFDEALRAFGGVAERDVGARDVIEVST